jgi:hypothetical protein
MNLTTRDVTLNFSHPVHRWASELFKALEFDGDHSGFGPTVLLLAKAYCDGFNLEASEFPQFAQELVDSYFSYDDEEHEDEREVIVRHVAHAYAQGILRRGRAQ